MNLFLATGNRDKHDGDCGRIFGYKLRIILSLGFWVLSAAKIQASQPDKTHHSSSQLSEPAILVTNLENLCSNTGSIKVTDSPVLTQKDQNWTLSSQATEPIASVANQEKESYSSIQNNWKASASCWGIEITQKQEGYQFAPGPILMAAPENFSPGLRLPPPPPPPKKLQPPATTTEPVQPFAVLENIQTDFRNDSNNFSQTNQFIEPTAQLRLQNGNRIRLKTGFNSFSQTGSESITNIPLKVGWEGKIGDVKLQTGMGVDLFNRLPTAINVNANAEIIIVPPKVSPSGKLISLLSISGNVEQGPYKFNLQTLENQITTWRFGPNLFWQIDRNTSFFSSYRFGSYNDGNSEHQSFSRLERKFGQFSLAANLFTWNYARNLERQSGYFSPPDFLVYNAELAWQGDIFSFLSCRLAANLGQQRLNGKIDNANAYQTRCTAKLAPNLEADLGYTFSNVRNLDTGGSAYNNNSFSGQLRLKF